MREQMVRDPRPPTTLRRRVPTVSWRRYDPPRPPGPVRSWWGLRSARRVQAWMLVLPVDALLIASPILWAPLYLKASVALAIVALAVLSDGGRYRARLHLSALDEVPRIVGRLLMAITLVAAVFVLRHDGAGVLDFLTTSLLVVPLVLTGRFATTAVILAARRRRLVAHRTVLIGGGPLAAEVAELLNRYPRYGLSVLGYVDDGEPGRASGHTAHLGSLADLADLVVTYGVEVLIVTEGRYDEAELLDRVRAPGPVGCDLLVVPRLHAFRTNTGVDDHVGSLPVMRIRTPSLRGPAWALKRAFDVVIAAAALVVLSPVLAACAVAVRLEGGPGVLFRQTRIGRDGRPFQCLKFRSMAPGSDVESATRWTVAGDPRIGPVGRVLRRTSCDELPQLWNILRGDMTTIGPRPERPHFVQRFSLELPRYGHRHRVPAGLTGLAQVSGLRGDTPIADRARFDNYYIENWSLWLDAKVLLRTVGEVVFARGR